MDLNENIKAMLSPGDETAAGTGYIISRDALTAQMISGEDRDAVKDFRVVDKSGEFTFELSDSWLYVFRTRVAFLCLNLSFNKIETLQAICNPGWAYNPAEFFWNDPMGESHPFSVEKWLSDFLSPLGIQKFFDGESSYLLDAYTYIFTVVPQWFENLEQMRKPVFNLHKMMPLDIESEDEAEEDIRYVYAARNQEKDAYRWGCCVTSQTISYIVAAEAMDFEAERRAQASVLSIVQILADGDLLIWVSTILTTIMLALVTALAIIRR